MSSFDAALEHPVVEELRAGESGVGVELLREEADVAAVVGEVLRVDGDAAEEDLAARRREEAGERAQQRGLAGAVRAEEADDAGREVEGDVVQGAEGAVGFGEVADGEGVSSRASSRTWRQGPSVHGAHAEALTALGMTCAASLRVRSRESRRAATTRCRSRRTAPPPRRRAGARASRVAAMREHRGARERGDEHRLQGRAHVAIRRACAAARADHGGDRDRHRAADGGGEADHRDLVGLGAREQEQRRGDGDAEDRRGAGDERAAEGRENDARRRRAAAAAGTRRGRGGGASPWRTSTSPATGAR